MTDALGRAALRPSVKAAVTIQSLSKKMLPDVRLMPLVNELQAQADLASNGNLQRTEGQATLETLAQIKNPSPVEFVRQANIANGPQQVNNGAGAASRAENFENQPSKLLEPTHGQRLDFGASCQTIGADSNLAAVDEGNRAEIK
jgi:hypothetical protein